MSELAPSATWLTQRGLRMESISRLVASLNHQQAVLRLELNALAQDAAGFVKFTGDELALHLGESPRTVDSWLGDAQLFCDYPTIVALVADGTWSLRHADALLDALAFSTLTAEQREQVIALVAGRSTARTPWEIRQATRAAILVLDPDAAERRYTKTKNDRSVTSYPHSNGGAALIMDGTNSHIAQAMAGLDALCQVRQPGDTRNLAQRRFDTLLDLICGRILPGQWTAYVMVNLDVLTNLLNDPTPSTPNPTEAAAGMSGAGVGGEIPGYGLITGAEATELLEQATIRRAVVDEHGQLISLDSTTLTPDAPAPAVVAPLRSDALEPTTVLERELEAQTLAAEATLAGQSAPTTADRQWAHTQHELNTQVALLTSRLEAELTALLAQPQHTRTPVGVGVGVGSSHRAPAGMTVQINSHQHSGGPGENGPSGGGGGGGQPPGPPDPPHDPHHRHNRHEPDDPHGPHDRQDRQDRPDRPDRPDPPDEPPPSYSDRDWHQAQLDPPFDQPPWTDRPLHPAPATPKARPSWTLPGLTRALTRLTTRPLDQRPLDSTAYALPTRLARHVKARDITCTFPGCQRLAQTCQNDHILPWPLGASTAHNIRSECTHHHQAKHTCFTVTALPSGGLTWTTLTGHSTTRYPRPFLRGW